LIKDIDKRMTDTDCMWIFITHNDRGGRGGRGEGGEGRGGGATRRGRVHKVA